MARMKRWRRREVPHTLLLRCALPLLGASLIATEAHGLIVWNGQVVAAWPEEAASGEPASGTAEFRSSEGSFYRAPKGETLGLTLLVDFSDQEPAFTREEISEWLDGLNYTAGNHNGGVRDYYLDISNGLLDLRNEVFGFYRAQHPKSHYESGPGYSGATELVEEMVEAFDDMVDFSRYDNDGDGRTDAVSIIYAGPSETFGQGLWPHAGSTNHSADGVRVSRYMMTQLGNELDTYVFAHETGHMLFDWPDLYGFGDYCIMGNRISTLNPVGVNDFFRADQGWMPVVDVNMDTPALHIARPNGAAYRYANPDEPDELFLWSNVQNTGRFAPLRGGGLLLLHFDHRRRTNDPPNPLALAVVQADGLNELNGTTWPMPGNDPDDYFFAGNNDEFSDMTNPSAAWNGGASSGLRIHAISANGSEMTFAVGEGEAPTTPQPEPDPVGVPGPGAAGAPGRGGGGGTAGADRDGGVESTAGRGGNGGAAAAGGPGADLGGAGSGGAGASAGAAAAGASSEAAGGTYTMGPSTATPSVGGSGSSAVGATPEPSASNAPSAAAPAPTPSAPPSASPSTASDSSSGGGCSCHLAPSRLPASGPLLGFLLGLLLASRRHGSRRERGRIES